MGAGGIESYLLPSLSSTPLRKTPLRQSPPSMGADGAGSRPAWVSILVLPPRSCELETEVLNSWEPQSPSYKMVPILPPLGH